MTDMVEKVARAIEAETIKRQGDGCHLVTGYNDSLALARAAIEAMREPSEAQWGGLARAIVMWMDMHPVTPRALFRHLEASGHDVPQWLRDEPEMKALDHVPSKGTRTVIIYRAMIDAALKGSGE